MTIRDLIGQSRQSVAEDEPSNRNMLGIFYACTQIGALCARSLHYQFYTWIYWSSPFLLWQTELPLPLQGIIWLAQEVAWNVYPATALSSLTAVLTLLLPIAISWYSNVDENNVQQYGRLQREARIRHGLKVN